MHKALQQESVHTKKNTELVVKKVDLKVPYYTVFHQYIIDLRFIQNMSLKCLALNTKQIIAALPIIPSVSALFQKC